MQASKLYEKTLRTRQSLVFFYVIRLHFFLGLNLKNQLYVLQPVLYSLYQNFDQPLCEQLFHWLCVAEDTRMQLSACTLLVRMCGLQPWWGDFLVSTLTNLYSSHQTSIFPQDRYNIYMNITITTSLWAKLRNGSADRNWQNQQASCWESKVRISVFSL